MLLVLGVLLSLAPIGTVRSQNVDNPVLDLGYAKYKGTYNETLQQVAQS